MFFIRFTYNIFCHAQATTLGVRKTPPGTVSHATTVPIKISRLNASGTRGRPRASDFDDFTKVVLEESISQYRSKISTNSPYPDRLLDRDLAIAAWVKACTNRNVQMDFDEDVMKLVCYSELFKVFANCYVCRLSLVLHKPADSSKLLHGPSLRHCTVSDQKITSASSGTKSKTFLNASASFIRFFFYILITLLFAELFQDPVTRKGIFRHPAIQTIINKMWFKNKNDEGLRHTDYSSGGIPLVLQALVLTAVSLIIDSRIRCLILRLD